MPFVFLIQFTVIKMENLEYRLLSLIYFMIMILIQLFPLVFVFLCDCNSTTSIVRVWDFSIKMFWSLFHGSAAITVH